MAYLTRAFAGKFSAVVRSRGRGYFTEGLVDITAGGSDAVKASVHGSQRYTVDLALKKNALFAGCTCPYFEDRGLCKHIWATLYAAEAGGHLRDTDRTGVRIVDATTRMDEPGDEDPLEPDDFSEEPQALFGEEDVSPGRQILSRPPSQPRRTQQRPKWAPWREQVGRIRAATAPPNPIEPRSVQWFPGQELAYVIDPADARRNGLTILQVVSRHPRKNGGWTRFQPFKISRDRIDKPGPGPLDVQIMTTLAGADMYTGYGHGYYRNDVGSAFPVSGSLMDLLIPLLCRTGRFGMRMPGADDWGGTPIRLDDGPPWEFRMEIAATGTDRFALHGYLSRPETRLELADIDLADNGGWLFHKGTVARMTCGQAFPWLAALRQDKAIAFGAGEINDFLAAVLTMPGLPPLALPDSLKYDETRLQPRPQVKVRGSKHPWEHDLLTVELAFDYAGAIIPAFPAERGMFQAAERRLILRDEPFESRAVDRLRGMCGRIGYDYSTHRPRWTLRAGQLPGLIRVLGGEGWRVEAEGRIYRTGGAFRAEVRSGIDWFELDGVMDFDGATVALPALLAGLRKGGNTVVLDDGTMGILPETWLKQWGWLTGAGSLKDGHLRFGRSQACLLDALLADRPEMTCDEAFQKARAELRRFAEIAPADPADSFRGALRDYQRDGLGWLEFLRRFGFGGCLADDMGLGKTVQVLAMLDKRRRERGGTGNADAPGPTLIVVPRSLVFNWKQEAARFTPELPLVEHVGMTRQKTAPRFGDGDIVLTTYGTLRRDIGDLKDVAFDYAILDEAQAVKNASTASAKAVRLVNARHRLALSGTPVENHLGELWSIIEFLNPGMLGSAPVFQTATRDGDGADEGFRPLLARALRPFILRRTKAQVAKDLLARTEQTLHCEFDTKQQAEYRELRDHYRDSLLARIDRDGVAKSKMHVLEALLRLRQAACHPGLIDKTRTGESSAKLEALIPQLEEVIGEGSKALVFSQFTSFLAIVRDRLDRAGITYAYLDGRTRDRAARVEQFQNDPNCRLFLISIKAGGLGLNLTAAEYVFILDPWWNPAVEAQAIDRTHRIGQKRHVFAYRLITRDTVEEKVLELQKAKRDLADAIINADNSLIRGLTREDLELLLG
ncbi:MAG: DEAD/DEAH box helicase [Planctomycetota bacterium]